METLAVSVEADNVGSKNVRRAESESGLLFLYIQEPDGYTIDTSFE